VKEIFHTVHSSCYGTVKNAFAKPMSYVYEWEPLFLIKTEEQKRSRGIFRS